MLSKTKEHRKKIAAIFIKSLEEKGLEWKKEWKGISMMPINGTNNKGYKGINRFSLSLAAMERKIEDPRWCTFLQIKNNDWKLKKGSKGEKIEYWMPYDKELKKNITWDEYNKRDKTDDKIMFTAKYYTVFSADDIEGIPPLPPIEAKDIVVDDLVKKLSKNMKVEIINDGGDKAFYRITEDKIHLPKPEHFENDYAYNSTALHELAHSTGASHRLNRDIVNSFGSKGYAFEELVAEITACFMSANLNISYQDSRMDNHKAYVQEWIQDIREKPETLIAAIYEGEKATNYMEYKAELLNEKEYSSTLNKTMEIDKSKIKETKVKTKNKKRKRNELSL